MDSQMQTSFVNHILSFFSQQLNHDKECVKEGTPPVASTVPAGSPDLPVLLAVLRAAGFTVKFSDKSDFGGVSNGCRAIILCKRSGTRVVLDGEGPCSCPPEEEMKHVLDPGPGTSQSSSRAASPTPSQIGLLEDPFRPAGCTIREESSPGASTGGSPPPVPKLSRQNTWSRDDMNQGPASPENRRLSAPPAPSGLQSSWATITGDELNVMAATDLLQEAISLLSGIKKVGTLWWRRETYDILL